MDRFPRRALVAGFLCFVGLCGTPALADPVRVTGGQAFLNWDGGPTSVNLSGNALLIFGEGFGGGPQGWDTGQLGDLDGSFAFSPLHTPFSATVNGTTYRAFLAGGLSFTTLPFVIPAAAGPEPVTFRTAFSISGRVRGYSAAERTGSPLFDIDLVGDGIASAIAFPVPGTSSYLSRIGTSYEFAPLAQTPEPGSVLLLATGALGVAVRYRARARYPCFLRNQSQGSARSGI